ncbi:MAG TPA: hypothetical protein VM433_12940, partial [Mycobacteriales bacterium]|nr:hypothetical protein [Mycobacteriales bacterium]
GLRGSALLRWRTGDVVDGITTEACPVCGRTVPRVVGTRRGALVPTLALRAGEAVVDLRAVTAALLGRPDLDDWRVELSRSARDGADQVLVHLDPAQDADPAAVALAVADAVQATSGLLPTQLVLAEPGRLPGGERGRVLLRR